MWKNKIWVDLGRVAGVLGAGRHKGRGSGKVVSRVERILHEFRTGFCMLTPVQAGGGGSECPSGASTAAPVIVL